MRFGCYEDRKDTSLSVRMACCKYEARGKGVGRSGTAVAFACPHRVASMMLDESIRMTSVRLESTTKGTMTGIIARKAFGDGSRSRNQLAASSIFKEI